MAVEGAFSVTIKNQLKIPELKKRLTAASEYALVQVANRLLADSRAFVPVLTGDLKDSGRVETMPTSDEAFRVIRVIYDMSYAEKQHEGDYWHPSLGYFGAAKYLAKPLELFGAYYIQLFEFEFKRHVEMGGAL